MRSPVVLDPRYVYAYTVYYGLAAAWGVLAARSGFASIAETAGAGYEAGFTLALAALSTILAVLTTTNSQRAEKWFTLGWLAAVVVIPVSAIYQWAATGELRGLAAAGFMYVVFPFTRYIYLARKTRKPKDG